MSYRRGTQPAMARSVPQILGLLGTKDPATVLVYPLALGASAITVERVAAWTGVWGADFGRLTARDLWSSLACTNAGNGSTVDEILATLVSARIAEPTPADGRLTSE